MWKIVLALWVVAQFAAPAWAAVDVNNANRAELEAVSGIGPSLAQRMLDERRKRSFTDWADLIARVNGLGAVNAAKLSAAGLTVGGSPLPSRNPVLDKPVDRPASTASAASR